MKHPFVSVIIPALDEETYLSRCLQSVRHQRYQNFEIIVIDNGSRDKTVAVAKSFGARVIEEKSKGTSFARDAGYKMAKGEIIVRTDSDGRVPKNWLTTIVSAFSNHPRAVALTGISTYYDAPFYYAPFAKYHTIVILLFARCLMGHHGLVGPNCAIRRSVVGQLWSHHNPSIHEDLDLSCHVSEYGEILFLPNLVVSISFRRFRRHPKAILDYTINIFRTILLHHPFLCNHTHNYRAEIKSNQ